MAWYCRPTSEKHALNQSIWLDWRVDGYALPVQKKRKKKENSSLEYRHMKLHRFTLCADWGCRGSCSPAECGISRSRDTCTWGVGTSCRCTVSGARESIQQQHTNKRRHLWSSDRLPLADSRKHTSLAAFLLFHLQCISICLCYHEVKHIVGDE